MSFQSVEVVGMAVGSRTDVDAIVAPHGDGRVPTESATLQIIW
jgi:hypothetical protein